MYHAAGYDKVFITDHDILTDGSVEISTLQGHIVALGIKTLPKRLEAVNVLNHIRKEGGVSILAHPNSKLFGWTHAEIDSLLGLFDGIEVWNSGCSPKYRFAGDKHKYILDKGYQVFPVAVDDWHNDKNLFHKGFVVVPEKGTLLEKLRGGKAYIGTYRREYQHTEP
jgi:predicted metal-dependent phosphoesterase TrpH